MFRTSKFLLMLTMLMVVIVTTSTLFPFIVGKYVFFRGVVDIALIFFLLGLLFDDKGSSAVYQRLSVLYKNPLVIAVTAFVAAFLLAGFFGFDPAFSFWSNFERGEGGLQMLHMYAFFVLILALFREEKDWQEIFWWALGGGVLMGIYGFFAAWGAQGFVGAKFSEASFRFQGSIGNPAYVATYILFLSFYALYLFSAKYKKKFFSSGGMTLFVLLAFFAVIFLLAATRGAFVGLVAAVVGVLAYLGFTNKKWRKKFSIAASAVIIVVGMFVLFQKSPIVEKIPGSRIFDLTTTAKTFQDRATMWKIAWDGFLQRPVFGWGPENYIHIFDKDFNTAYFVPSQGFGAWFDRAHSVIFDYLAETGLVGFLAYASMFAALGWLFWKYERSDSSNRSNLTNSSNQSNLSNKSNSASLSPFERSLFVGIIFAYLVQGLVLFDVSVTYINLFLVMAFAVFKLQMANGKEQMARGERQMESGKLQIAKGK